MAAMKTILIAFVLLASCVSCRAAPLTFQNWNVYVMANGDVLARTRSDSGEVLTRFCEKKSEKCAWLLDAPVRCDKDIHVPALVSTSQGAATYDLQCLGRFSPLNTFSYAISGQPALDGIVFSTTGIIGIAYPLDNGMFRVNRFSMAGASQAYSAMNIILNKENQKTQGTSSTTL